MNKIINQLLYEARAKDGEIWPCITRDGKLKTWLECIDVFNSTMYLYYNLARSCTTRCVHKAIKQEEIC